MTGDGRLLVLFPGAGSFGSEFHPLRSAAGVNSKVMRYPGRSGRDAGKGDGSFEEVVTACCDQITGLPDARPVLFGHSYGAYLAYATALALAQRSVQVAAVVVAGASAPDLLRVPPEATTSPTATAAYLDAADPGQLATAAPEWREAVAETAQHDLGLLARWTVTSPPARVSCPVLGLRGAQDPLTSDASVARWQDFTQNAFAQRTFEGGHSALLGDPRLVDRLREELEDEEGGARPGDHRTAGPSTR